MKVKDLKSVIFSQTGNIQLCIVYDIANNVDLENGCSVEYAYEHYGEREVKRISADFEQGYRYVVFHII